MPLRIVKNETTIQPLQAAKRSSHHSGKGVDGQTVKATPAPKHTAHRSRATLAVKWKLFVHMLWGFKTARKLKSSNNKQAQTHTTKLLLCGAAHHDMTAGPPAFSPYVNKIEVLDVTATAVKQNEMAMMLLKPRCSSCL